MLDIHLVVTANPAEVRRHGPRHPVLGGLWELGTIATLLGVSARSVDALTADMAEWIRIRRHHGPLTASLREQAESKAATEPVVVIVVPDGCGPVADGDALLVIAGPDLPIMGEVPAVNLETVRDTLLFALGKGGRGVLFTEPDPDTDIEQEIHLSARLRQLYGE